jgi:hypothetical protein
MDNTQNNDEMLALLKELSLQDFKEVGLDQVAYIKRIKGKSETPNIYAIHAADGSQISVMDSYDTALAVIRVHDLYPVTVH